MQTFKELREQLTPEDIKRILSENYGIEPYYDKEECNYIIYRTCCHNLEGGSNKLYYYKNTHIFKCYTECGLFDIFELLIKLEALRGHIIGKMDAIAKTGLIISSTDRRELQHDSIVNDLNRLYEINNTDHCDINNLDLKPLDVDFLDERFIFDAEALKIWQNEGISLVTMLNYKISYDSINNCIIIPQFDLYGNIVGVRGRYFDEDAVAKYKPIVYNGKLLSHPKSKTLYGLYQNKSAIALTKTVIIFEGEKSILRLDSIDSDKNISVATCGQGITREHIQLLLSLGVHRVILAYDADYLPNSEDMNEVWMNYKRRAEALTTFFDVSVIFDTKGRLGYKDSPIDKGIDIFNQLMKERIIL